MKKGHYVKKQNLKKKKNKKNKRIAELQQTAGPLKLGVSKFEMAVSRSHFLNHQFGLYALFILLRATLIQNKCMFAAIETINQYADTPRSRFKNKPPTFKFLICLLYHNLVKKNINRRQTL